MKFLISLLLIVILSTSQSFAGGGDIYAVRMGALLSLANSPITQPMFKMLMRYPLQWTEVIDSAKQKTPYFKLLGSLTEEELVLLRLAGVSVEDGTLIKIGAKTRYQQLRTVLDPFYSFYFVVDAN